MPSRKILFVSVEPLWPSTHGGRIRTARIAENLAVAENVLVTAPLRPEHEAHEAPPGVAWRPLSWNGPRGSFGRLHWLPWLGIYALPNADELQTVVDDFQPDYIYWSHSYMAAVGMRAVHTHARHIVEFANIERERYRSLARYGRLRNRTSAAFESLKASIWERSVSRNADLCVAINHEDRECLTRFGARVVLVENGMPDHPVGPSPNKPRVLSVANWDYAPNRHGIVSFLERHWAQVLAAIPDAQLVIAGKGSQAICEASGSPNVHGLGFVEDLSDEYRDAAIVLAPAKSGAGSQLKVAEALGHSRCVVGPAFLTREIRPGLPAGALRASEKVGQALVEGLRDPAQRWRVEQSISEYVKKHTWQYESQKLSDLMKAEAQ